MGTYTYLKLRDVSTENIESVNAQLLGLPNVAKALITLRMREVFIGNTTVSEALDFLNNNSRGLRQYYDIPRPMSAETFLSLAFPFVQIGLYNDKISRICGLVSEYLEEERSITGEEQANLVIYFSTLQWAWLNQDYIDFEASSCWLLKDITEGWIPLNDIIECCQRLNIWGG